MNQPGHFSHILWTIAWPGVFPLPQRLDVDLSQAQPCTNYPLIHVQHKCLALLQHNTLSSGPESTNTTITCKSVTCLPSKIHTSQYTKKYSNYKIAILIRFTLSILLPTSIFMMSFFVEYISTSFSHSSSFSKVSLLLVSYTNRKQTPKLEQCCYSCTWAEHQVSLVY